MSIWNNSISLILVGFLLFSSASLSADTLQTPQYELELNFEPAAKQCSGRAIVQLPSSAIKDGTASFDISYSHGAGVSINRITGNSGRDLKYSIRDSNKILEVELGDQQEKLTLEYSFPVDETSLEPYGYYKWSDSPLFPEVLQADGNSFRFSDFRVSFEYPSTLSVLTTGGEGELQRQGNRIIANYAARHVAGFAIVAGEGFEVTRREEGGVPIVAFYHPKYAEKFSTVIERTIEAASWYKNTYGFFPLEQVGIIQGHPTWGGGYPLPNMFAVHLGHLNDERITWITAHELGHYYWGYTVLSEESDLAWLQLSLGIWADQLYLAERKGISMPEQWRSAGAQGSSFKRYLVALVANHNQEIGLSREEARNLDFDYGSLIRHGKAAVAVYLQSLLIGSERFLDLQRHILKEFRHRPLSEKDFTSILTEFGIENAPVFYDAWKRGDATIGLFVSRVSRKEGSDEWTIELIRTGPVPYPIEVEAISRDGRRVRHEVSADARSDKFDVEFVPVDIRIDPRGFIPMASSSHPKIQLLYILAHELAGLDEPFFVMGRAYLDRFPDEDHLRYRLARRLYELARWEESSELWSPGRAIEGRDGLLAALYSARALSKLGRESEALNQLDELKEMSEQFGVIDLWETVRNEADQ
jgi:hypothetical protein